MTQDSSSIVGGTFAPVAPARKHDWIGGKSWELLGHESPSGCDETHRQCANCPTIKITVHPPQGFPYREWQHINGKRWQGEHAPPCVGTAQEVKFQ